MFLLMVQPTAKSLLNNKAVTDRKLRPRCCHLGLGSYFMHPKNSPVRPVGKTACALRFSCVAASTRATLAYE